MNSNQRHVAKRNTDIKLVKENDGKNLKKIKIFEEDIPSLNQ